MINLNQFIERCLAKRQALLPKLETVHESLRDLTNQLGQLERLANEAKVSEDATQNLQQRATILSANISDLVSQINEAEARTVNLLARFAKNTITIGVAGKARQGKSTILQAVTGLDDRVIPTSDGLPCTGAKSLILNRSHDPHAEIEFYTEQVFLQEIVHAYYDELGLPAPPTSLDEFQRSLLPKPEFDKPEEHAVYDRLRELHRSIDVYRPLLSRSPQRVSLSEVRDYVSQEGGRKKYVAVRCAKIFVPFPNLDVTGLAIVDLPGLGEIAKGHSAKLVQSLQQEVDAIILVKRPSPGGDDWFASDIKVFNEIKQAVPELDLADWLFIVLNRDDHNSKQVEILKSRPPQIGSSPRLLAVNCRCPEAVRQEVLLEVLHHLEHTLERMDLRQLSVLSEELGRLAKSVSSVVQPVREYFQQDTVGVEDFQKFGQLFRTFCKRLRTNLDELTDECREAAHINAQAGDLAKAIEDACDKAKTTVPVPSSEDLKGRFHDLGGWKAVVQEELHYLRSYLTHCLAETLDTQLAEMVGSAQRQIMTRVLGDPLARLLPPELQGSNDPKRQLEAFRRLLDPASHPTLIAGVDYLLAFTFSYQSHYHHRVREVMNVLDPMAFRDEGEDDPVSAIAPRSDDARRAEDVARGLRSFYERAVWNVRKRLLQETNNEPSRAIFAMVEEARDRLVRSRDIEREWESLLYPRRADIWPREFNRYAVASALRQHWQAVISTVDKTVSTLRSALK
ncbi:MAG: dynamin family protein [Thermogemmata sp.]|nr:dynamin family protein [Thermogemmata sp.]